MVDACRGLQAIDFTTLQRRLFNVDQLIEGAISEYRQEEIESWFVDPHLTDGKRLQKCVDSWLEEQHARPLSIIGPYGTGKSTFSLHLAAKLAETAKGDLTKRVPIRVPLAEVYDEQSMEGLFGKLLASRNRIRNYHYNLFRELNSAGRFVLIFDGFDEMKHGMTIHTFERNVTRLLTLDEGEAKIIILGRDTAFHNDYEFQSVIDGVQLTANGQPVHAEGRRSFDHLHLRDFTVAEAHDFVRRFFPVQVHRTREGSQRPDDAWLQSRIAELTAGTFDELLQRPVHARMLCQIATQPQTNLKQLTKFGLYDMFVHHLLEREYRKEGRYSGFDRDCRRSFNAAIAWWLYEQGGASTVTLSDIPDSLIKEATKGITHSLKEAELRRELTAGLLVEKREGGVVYFSHRSIQEFLVSEHLIQTDLLQGAGLGSVDPRKVLPLLSEVVTEFLIQRLQLDKTHEMHRKWMQSLKRLGGPDIDVTWLELFRLVGSTGSEALDASPISWSPLVQFIVANRASTFKFESRSGALTAQDLLDRVATTEDVSKQAAIFLLAVRCFQENTHPTSILASLIAQCLNKHSIEAVEAELTKKGRAHRCQIIRDENLPFWLFHRLMKPEREDTGEWFISINLRQLEGDMSEITGYGFIRSAFALPIVKVSLSDVLREIHRLAQLAHGGWDRDIAKRFIEDRETRGRITPLVVRVSPSAFSPTPRTSSTVAQEKRTTRERK